MTGNTRDGFLTNDALTNGANGGVIDCENVLNQDYGTRLLPRVVDELAQVDPERVYASIPIAPDVCQGFRDVTIRDMASAANSMAWWLEKTVGKSDDFETLSYMGITDLRYPIIFLAAVKCGYKLLLPSPRNPCLTNLSLFRDTNCSKLLHCNEMASKAREIQQLDTSLHLYNIPTFEQIVQQSSRHYPYSKTYTESRWDPCLILQSSGSTGPPKPITLNHGFFSVVDNDRSLPQVAGRRNQNASLFDFKGGGRFFSAFPIFHLAGVMSAIAIPIFYNASVVFAPPFVPPSGALVSQIMHQQKLRSIYCPPTVIEQLVQEPEGLNQMKQLDAIQYGGGPLAPATGDLLSKMTDLCGMYGATETGATQALVPLPGDWSYMEWHPMLGADMQPSVGGTYELVFHRNPKLETIRGLSHTFPDVEVYRTKDLFQPHPTKPNLWRYYSRVDDIIVLSNGEKFNPIQSEAIIQLHPLLSGAIIIGQGRFQPALLVEPQENLPSENRLSLIEDIWPVIEQANRQAPEYGRITRAKVLVATAGKRFHRAAKGTIVRRMTNEIYAAEIEELYSEDIDQSIKDYPILEASADLSAIKQFVSASIYSLFPKTDIRSHDNFFVQGLDSLKTSEIAGLLKAGLRAHYEVFGLAWLSSRTIYANPTIDNLSEAIHDHISPDLRRVVKHRDPRPRETKMAELVHKYTRDLPSTLSPIYVPQASHINIVLTGSTGSLGARLLAVLLSTPTVSRIFCLDRSKNALERHERKLADRGLDHCLRSRKVEFLCTDLGRSRLGLSIVKFAELTNCVNVIIHTAWKVDFNQSLESFEDEHVSGVRHLVDFSLGSALRPRILFISSVSSSSNGVATNGSYANVPETVFNDYGVAQKMGYGESKHVSERILGIASDRTGVPISILRVGQIAGPIAGGNDAWPEAEWMPSLVKTSKSLGLIPDFDRLIDWIPIDSLASIILEIALRPNEPEITTTTVTTTTTTTITTSTSTGTTTTTETNTKSITTSTNPSTLQIYNLVNPRVATWASLLPSLQRHLPNSKVVSLQEWVSTLQRLDPNDMAEICSKPALKILGMYERLQAETMMGQRGITYDTANGVRVSKTMRELQPVQGEWMDRWMEQWGYGVSE